MPHARSLCSRVRLQQRQPLRRPSQLLRNNPESLLETKSPMAGVGGRSLCLSLGNTFEANRFSTFRKEERRYHENVTYFNAGCIAHLYSLCHRLGGGTTQG